MGEILGRYTLYRRIGVGGMAEVFLAREAQEGGGERLCVVKRAHPFLASDTSALRMFLDEAQLVAQLRHPNIVQIFDLGSINGAFYIAMEYVPGFDLLTIVQEHERQGELIAEAVAARLVAQAAAALDHAHRAVGQDGRPLEIIHRDVSPQNILLSTGGEVKLTDFGVAKASIAKHATQLGIVKGKYAYMSPEQIAGNPVDCRTDIYALGLVGDGARRAALGAAGAAHRASAGGRHPAGDADGAGGSAPACGGCRRDPAGDGGEPAAREPFALGAVGRRRGGGGGGDRRRGVALWSVPRAAGGAHRG
ncbi:MAG: serine/threonine-protein kinase [Myxococcaceae bacterium]